MLICVLSVACACIVWGVCGGVLVFEVSGFYGMLCMYYLRSYKVLIDNFVVFHYISYLYLLCLILYFYFLYIDCKAL